MGTVVLARKLISNIFRDSSKKKKDLKKLTVRVQTPIIHSLTHVGYKSTVSHMFRRCYGIHRLRTVTEKENV